MKYRVSHRTTYGYSKPVQDSVGLFHLMPRDLPDAAALPALIGAMEAHGYGSTLILKIASENWIGVLERTWGE